MSDRLTRIYTRGGDQGKTSLANGQRVSKASLRIEALGAIDELNSYMGVLDAHLRDEKDIENPFLRHIQNDLFDIGGELAVADSEYCVITAQVVQAVEVELDRLNTDLPPLREFILPGGSVAAAHCHMARSLCRRAERLLVALFEHEHVNQQTLCFLNRLSDFLFVYARVLAKMLGGSEVLWKKRAPSGV